MPLPLHSYRIPLNSWRAKHRFYINFHSFVRVLTHHHVRPYHVSAIISPGGLAAPPPKAAAGRDDPAVGHHDDFCVGSLCGRGHLRAAGVAHLPHLHRADDDRVLSKPIEPFEGQAVGRGERVTRETDVRVRLPQPVGARSTSILTLTWLLGGERRVAR